MRSNAQRVSTIIDNVLQPLAPRATAPERLQLSDVVRGFREEFCETMQCA